MVVVPGEAAAQTLHILRRTQLFKADRRGHHENVGADGGGINGPYRFAVSRKNIRHVVHRAAAHAQHQIQAAQARVGVHHQHPMAQLGQGAAQPSRHGGLASAAFSRCDNAYQPHRSTESFPGGPWTHLFASPFGA